MSNYRIFKAVLLGLLITSLTGCADTEDIGMYGGLNGKVTDYHTNEPISNASINLSPSGISIQTDESGYYRFENLDPQQYTLTVQKTGYQPDRKSVSVIRGENLDVNFQLRTIPTE